MPLTKQIIQEVVKNEIQSALKPVIGRIDKLEIRVDKRFEQVDKRFEQVDKRFEQVDKRFEQVDKRFEQVDKRFDDVDKRFDRLERKIDNLTDIVTEFAGEIKDTRDERVLMGGQIARNSDDIAKLNKTVFGVN